MRSLCTLVYISMTLAAFRPHAEPLEVIARTSLNSTSGNPSIQTPKSEKRGGSVSTVTVNSPRFINGVRLSLGATQQKNDYSNYSLRDGNGGETVLSREFNKPESSFAAGVDYLRGSWGVSLNSNASIGESPFTRVQNDLGFSYSFMGDISQLNLKISHSKQEQPKNFYIHPKSGRETSRPTQIEYDGLTLGLGTVHTEKIRATYQLSLGKQSDRPSSYGAGGLVQYALSRNDFLGIEVSRYTENQQETLKDERGYFDLSSVEFGYSRYLTFDWLISTKFGLVVEVEDNPQVLRKDQFALNVSTLGIQYEGKQFIAELTAQYMDSNSAYRASSGGGQVTWKF